jgi:hypothetical protein
MNPYGAVGSRAGWSTVTLNLQLSIYKLRRLGSKKEGVGTCWHCHVFVTFRNKKGSAIACKPLCILAPQALQFAQQTLVEWALCDRIIDRAAIELCGARDVIQRLGAAFDLQ